MREHDNEYGPKLQISKEIHALKYRGEGESFYEAQTRFANALKDSPQHFTELREILLGQRFMGGGRTQSAIGSPRDVTAFNCFVSETIPDSMEGIMNIAKDAALTMKMGGGIGFDFSTLRPKDDLIVSLDSRSSGAVSFMDIFNSVCNTIASAGHRRGAMMGVMRVDHPDIEEFLHAKRTDGKLTSFNISIAITDKFMEHLKSGELFPLEFDGRVYKKINPKNLWDEIMRSTWDWAEPGVLFIDRINEWNNLKYCEIIAATNPCGEQPLPPGGACLLGSFNLTKYVGKVDGAYEFDYELFKNDIKPVIRAMDNIHDNTSFPLPIQAKESADKRRMGIGVTGVANAIEVLGHPYGSKGFLEVLEKILTILRDESYRTSALLAKEKGAFPLYTEEYLNGKFIKTLPQEIQALIKQYGIRNSHLLSIAPTGTISLTADNVSGGIEPVFSHYYDRTIQTYEGPIVERVSDYAYREWGIAGKKADECTPKEHLDVLAVANKFVDSAVSKTINVSDALGFENFGNIYLDAYELGCKGVTTFNKDGKRFGILNDVKEEEDVAEGAACFIDPVTGQKECS